MMTQERELITVREAAERFNRTMSTFRDWIRRGKLTVYKPELGQGLLLDAEEIERKLTPKRIRGGDKPGA